MLGPMLSCIGMVVFLAPVVKDLKERLEGLEGLRQKLQSSQNHFHGNSSLS